VAADDRDVRSGAAVGPAVATDAEAVARATVSGRCTPAGGGSVPVGDMVADEDEAIGDGAATDAGAVAAGNVGGATVLGDSAVGDARRGAAAAASSAAARSTAAN